MNLNEVVSVITSSGEYVGKFKSQNDDGTVTVSDPRLLISQDGGVGFAKGVCMTGELNTEEVVFRDYVYYTKTSEDLDYKEGE
jgi:hypothetical protein